MVKKVKQGEPRERRQEQQEQQLTSAIRDAAQQIWQAGLGEFAKARQEGGVALAALAEEDGAPQKRPQHHASGGARTGDSWDKLEHIFEERVARALHRIGVPTHGQIGTLERQVAQLSAQVEQLAEVAGAGPARSPAAAPKRSAKARAASGAAGGKVATQAAPVTKATRAKAASIGKPRRPSAD
ncbi:MAG: phasin family protein [Pseudomonadota bacterium]